MQTVDIDLDGVVYPPLAGVVSDYIYERTRTRYDRVARQWDYYKDWEIEQDKLDGFIRSGIKEGIIFGRGDPVPGAVDGLKRIDAQGYRIRLVTSRLAWPGLHGVIQRNTATWLDKHRVPYHSIWYQGKGDTKNTDGILLLDDHPENVRAHGRGVLLAELKNRDDREGIERVVETWPEFVKMVEDYAESDV